MDDKSSGAYDILPTELAAFQDEYAYPADLQKNLQEISQKAWEQASKAKRPKTFHISAEQWEALGRTLARFLEGQRSYALALKKQDFDKIAAIRQFSSKLVNEIVDVGSADNARAEGALTAWLDDQDITIDEFVRFVEFAERLSTFDPRNSSSFEHQTVWLSEKELRSEAKDNGPFFSHLTRGELQLRLDEWWSAATGGSTSVEDSYQTLYKEFLFQLLRPIKVKNAPGYSHTAVIKARREGKMERKGRAMTADRRGALQEGLRRAKVHLTNFAATEDDQM